MRRGGINMRQLMLLCMSLPNVDLRRRCIANLRSVRLITGLSPDRKGGTAQRIPHHQDDPLSQQQVLEELFRIVGRALA